MLSRTTEIAVNAGECVFSICAYDNEAGDAVVLPHNERVHYAIYSFNEAYLFSNSYLFPR